MIASGTNYDRLSCEIRITRANGDLLKFFQAVEIEAETSMDTLTDTCIVTLPMDNRWVEKDSNGYNQYRMVSGNREGFFSIGDEIEVCYGYNFNNTLEFQGFITEVEPNSPLRLICQDRSWKLKKNRLMFSKPGPVHLKDILPMLIEGTGVEIHPQTYEQSITFGGLSVPGRTTAQLLEEWREMGLISFMKEGKLVIGRSYFSSSAGVYSSSLTKGYIPPVLATNDNVIEDDLRIATIEASEVAIRAVSMQTRSNKSHSVTLVKDPQTPSKMLVVEVHDERLTKSQNEERQSKIIAQVEKRGIFLEDYFIKTHHEINLDKDQLIEAAKAAFPKYLRSGLEGSCLTFGDYPLRVAETICFLDPRSPDKNGEYLVRSLQKSWGAGGIRQRVEIPHKIKNIG
ncbi:hypothetical protein ACFSC6_11110 [Rufibacter sediminis]|uniref:Uncharacterized protein n=1 Tax=Rufibacter sediminis TaxID=2762756 RepID=A0ABR6VU57_9BACT|nr:hypothetical protein [Rufibacter sediminis]MBC3540429.1 hypothetical protein [Rufibacter sediminis]